MRCILVKGQNQSAKPGDTHLPHAYLRDTHLPNAPLAHLGDANLPKKSPNMVLWSQNYQFAV